MRWSIVRLIWMRELRDQLRDRRTVLMVAVLPLVLYPLLGAGLVEVAGSFGQAPQVVGVYGLDNLPTESDASDAAKPLLVEGPNGWRPSPAYIDPDDPKPLEVRGLSADEAVLSDPTAAESLAALRRPLDAHAVDLVVIVPRDFARRVGEGGRPALLLLDRDNDDLSHAVRDRFTGVLVRWKMAITRLRLKRLGLPANFDDPFRIDDAKVTRSTARRAADDLFGMLLRVFPFVLVMWSMVGASTRPWICAPARRNAARWRRC